MTKTIQDNWKNIFFGLLLLIVLIAIMGFDGKQSEPIGIRKFSSEFYDYDNRYHEVIEESEKHFNARNLEGALFLLDDDFGMYKMTENGSVRIVHGADEARKAVGPFMEGGALETLWIGSNVFKWGLDDNILVQVEEDYYKSPDGTNNRIKSLVVFEHRDGKRWREWRFRLEDK